MGKLEEQTIKVESYSFTNDVLVEHKVEDRQLKWLSPSGRFSIPRFNEKY